MSYDRSVRSAWGPVCQLTKPGTARSLEALTAATGVLSDDDLQSLEDEIAFFDQTGLVGVRMSKLLVLLLEDAEKDVA